jgi:hypothetical protein
MGVATLARLQGCQRKPRADRKHSGELNELYGFMAQSNISTKNVRRLETLCQASDDLVREPARAILQVASMPAQSAGAVRA